jgi:hypothetical protein
MYLKTFPVKECAANMCLCEFVLPTAGYFLWVTASVDCVTVFESNSRHKQRASLLTQIVTIPPTPPPPPDPPFPNKWCGSIVYQGIPLYPIHI